MLHTRSEIMLLAFHLLFLTLADYPFLLLYELCLMLSHFVILSTFHTQLSLPSTLSFTSQL